MTEKPQSRRERDERLARQLRENLKRRKAQARTRGVKERGSEHRPAKQVKDTV